MQGENGVLVIPVGVTEKTVKGVLGLVEDIDHIIAVTVPGFEGTKEDIFSALEEASRLLGVGFTGIVIPFWNPREPARLYTLLKRLKARRVYLVGVTGSRYLQPILTGILLRYWRETGAETYLIHGVEGGEYRIEPLPGYYVFAMRLSKVQRRLLEIIYGSQEPVSGKMLREKYGFGIGVYDVLADMERKGLLRVRRGRIEKTFPGMLAYSLLLED